LTDKIYNQKYYQLHKEEMNKRSKEWAKINKTKAVQRSKEWKLNHPEAWMLCQAKSRAKRYGFEFNIDITDVIIPEVCPYFGFKLEKGTNKNSDNSPSLDRIDNTKGYIKGNVEVISYLANRLKNNATSEQLVMFANAILRKIKLAPTP